MKYTVPRGTKDILPEEITYWHTIEKISRQLFDLYQYKELRTPIFESTDLFVRSIGDETDIVEKEMYTFTDKGGRSLTLRPEGTASIVRSFLQNSFHKTQRITKCYYVGPMFRYERPQAGRFRQFHQIGIENLGSPHPFADAEVISLGIHLFDELGLSDLSVSINSVGCPLCRPVIEERLKQFLGINLTNLCNDCQHRFENKPLRILDCKNKKCQEYFAGMPDIRKSHCQECNDHFNSVLDYLDSLGIVFHINPHLVRGLDYYTRTAFEIHSDQLGAQNAICGGGRYDNLVEYLGGPPTPAVGFAFGVERAVMILKNLNDNKVPTADRVDVFIAPIGAAEQLTKGFYLLDELRRAGIKCEMDYLTRDLNKQLKLANKINARFTLIYGEEEAERQIVVLKNMDNRDQKEISLDTLIPSLKEEINV